MYIYIYIYTPIFRVLVFLFGQATRCTHRPLVRSVHTLTDRRTTTIQCVHFLKLSHTNYIHTDLPCLFFFWAGYLLHTPAASAVCIHLNRSPNDNYTLCSFSQTGPYKLHTHRPFLYCFPFWGRLSAVWPLQDIRLLLVVCARINRPFICSARLHCPHCCNAIARLLDNKQPPSTSLLYATHRTILVITISCKGEVQVLEQVECDLALQPTVRQPVSVMRLEIRRH